MGWDIEGPEVWNPNRKSSILIHLGIFRMLAKIGLIAYHPWTKVDIYDIIMMYTNIYLVYSGGEYTPTNPRDYILPSRPCHQNRKDPVSC